MTNLRKAKNKLRSKSAGDLMKQDLPEGNTMVTGTQGAVDLLAKASQGAKKRKRLAPSQKVTAVKLDDGAYVMTSPEALGKRDSITLSTVPAAERHVKFTLNDQFSRLVSEIYQVCETSSSMLPGEYKLEIPFVALPHTHYVVHVLHRSSVVSKTSSASSTSTVDAISTPVPPNGRGSTAAPPQSPIVSPDGWVVVSENVVVSIDGNILTVTSSSPGWWMVVSTVKEEFFTVPMSGMLFSSRLSRFVSGRFPKGAVQLALKERRYRHRMIPIPNEILKNFQATMLQLADIVTLSDIFELEELPSPANPGMMSGDLSPEFGRAATIRLPLPELPSKLPDRDGGWRIYYRSTLGRGSSWIQLDQPTKQVTRTSLAFDVRRLGCYIVAYTVNTLNPYLGNAVTFVYQQTFIMPEWQCVACSRGTDGVFWVAFNLVRNAEHRDEWYAKKAPRGYKPLRTAAIIRLDNEDLESGNSKVALPGGRSRAPLSKRFAKPSDTSGGIQDVAGTLPIDPLAIHAGQFIRLSVQGDMRWADTSKKTDYVVQVNPYLADHDVEIRIDPVLLTDNVRQLSGNLRVALVCDDNEYRDLANFAVDLGKEQVKEWYDILHPPPPPIPVTKPAKEMDPFDRLMANNPLTEDANGATKEKKAAKPGAVGFQKQVSESFARLTAQPESKRRIDFTREPRVLSGRSLHALACELRDGLVLALNLGLPDSMVTGIGFDALSEGLSLTEVTYRILLLWKRRTSRDKDQIEQLLAAIMAVNRHDMVEMIHDHAVQNAEVMPTCIAEYRNLSHPKGEGPSEEELLKLPQRDEMAREAINNGAPQQGRHVVSGKCQAQKLMAEAKEQRIQMQRQQEERQKQRHEQEQQTEPMLPKIGLQQHQQQHQQPVIVQQASYGPTSVTSVKIEQLPAKPKLIGIENGPVPPFQAKHKISNGNSNGNGSSHHAYLSKLAPMIAVEDSRNFVADGELILKSKNSFENAINHQEAPLSRPSTPTSDGGDESMSPR